MSTLFPRGWFDHAVNARDWVMERNPANAEKTFTTHWTPLKTLVQEALLIMYGKDTLANDYVLPVVGRQDKKKVKPDQLAKGYTFFEAQLVGEEEVYFSNLLSWRKLLPPIGILKFIGFLYLVLFGLLDRLLQTIQLRPYKLFIGHYASDDGAIVNTEKIKPHPARKAFWILYMGCIFIPIRFLIYAAFRISFGVIKAILQPADSIIRTWLRFFDQFETENTKTQIPFYLSIAIAAAVSIIVSLLLFAPASMGGLSSTAIMINSFIHNIPLILNSGLEIFSKVCLTALSFPFSLTLCERIISFVRDEKTDVEGLLKGNGGDTFIKTNLTSTHNSTDMANSISSIWTHRSLISKVGVNAHEDCLTGTAAFFGASPDLPNEDERVGTVPENA